MSHLENLIAEYYDWRGYVVKRNIKVGRLTHGGWEGELDIVAYHPHTHHLIHIEPSIDAHSWKRRAERFTKKFGSGEKYIFDHIFTWLDRSTPVDKVAVLISHPKDRDEIAGARILSIDEFMSQIRADVIGCGVISKNAIPEQYPYLRTLQMSHNGYYKVI